MKVCECTNADYECDVGYYRNHKHGKCIRDFSVNNYTARAIRPKHCPLSGLYEISNGYRLTGGNTCVGGIQIGPTVYQCSNGFLGISSGGWFVIFIVILLAVSMICMSKNKNNEDKNI